MFKKFQALAKGGKYAYEMLVPKISKNLKKFQENKENIIKTTDKYTKGLTEEGKTKVRKFVGPALGKLSKITQQFPEKKAKGGRIGYKSGTNPFARKSNIKKIQETFGPKQAKKKEKPKARMMAKDGTKNKKATKFGMLSVKAGIDKDPNPTYADKIAGAKMKNKKKFI